MDATGRKRKLNRAPEEFRSRSKFQQNMYYSEAIHPVELNIQNFRQQLILNEASAIAIVSDDEDDIPCVDDNARRKIPIVNTNSFQRVPSLPLPLGQPLQAPPRLPNLLHSKAKKQRKSVNLTD
mmetsp:Transcript_6361/g.9792  ORF Transcript_6361/g.9792 Transcript_6361/m.9792 type:complete len:124 (-) Transcript_6361:117-488(-)